MASTIGVAEVTVIDEEYPESFALETHMHFVLVFL
jgi:hypothetical protein